MKDYSGAGIGGALALVFAILLGIVKVFVMPSEVGGLYAADGRSRPVTALTGFWALLPIVAGFVWVIKPQGWLNRFWAGRGSPA